MNFFWIVETVWPLSARDYSLIIRVFVAWNTNKFGWRKRNTSRAYYQISIHSMWKFAFRPPPSFVKHVLFSHPDLPRLFVKVSSVRALSKIMPFLLKNTDQHKDDAPNKHCLFNITCKRFSHDRWLCAAGPRLVTGNGACGDSVAVHVDSKPESRRLQVSKISEPRKSGPVCTHESMPYSPSQQLSNGFPICSVRHVWAFHWRVVV